MFGRCVQRKIKVLKQSQATLSLFHCLLTQIANKPNEVAASQCILERRPGEDGLLRVKASVRVGNVNVKHSVGGLHRMLSERENIQSEFGGK